MIQRIQTLFMLLFVIAGGVNFFLFPSEIIIFEPLIGNKADSSPYVSILLSLIVLINIGLYQKRTIQIRVNQVIWVLYTLFWGSFVYMIIQHQANNFKQYLLDLMIAFAGEIMLLLANRFIKKDETLIRSLDRLR